AALGDDRAGVVLFGHDVDAAARDLHPGVEHRLVHVVAKHALTAEQRQKRGVDVQDLAAPLIENLELAEKAGQHDQIDRVRRQQLANSGAERGRVGRFPTRHDVRLDAGFAGDLDAADFRAGGDDDGDLDVQLTGPRQPDEVL